MDYRYMYDDCVDEAREIQAKLRKTIGKTDEYCKNTKEQKKMIDFLNNAITQIDHICDNLENSKNSVEVDDE